MKITVDLPENDLRDICRITGITKKGPAIRQLLESTLQLERRKALSDKFITGEWGTELSGFEKSKAADKKKAETQAGTWRD